MTNVVRFVRQEMIEDNHAKVRREASAAWKRV